MSLIVSYSFVMGLVQTSGIFEVLSNIHFDAKKIIK